MTGFIDEYYLNPIRYPTAYAPYNVVNTVTYALLALVAVFLIFKALRKLKVPVDRAFYRAIMGFVAFGGLLRVTEDAQLFPRTVEWFGMQLHPFVTPGIYVLVFLSLAASFLGWKAARTPKEKLVERVGWTGYALAGVTLITLVFSLYGRVTGENALWLAEMLVLAFAAVLAFELVKKKYDARAQSELKPLERTTVFSQAMDGAATFIGVGVANYGEQHLVANAVFQFLGGPFAFYLLKLAFVLAVVFVFRKEAGTREEHVYLLTLVSILGLAPGIRDATRIFFNV